jgi:hypothetical protein
MSYPSLIESRETTDDRGVKTGKWVYSVEGMFTEESLVKFKVLRNNVLVDVDIQQLLRELAVEAWPELGAPAIAGQPSPLAAAFAGVAFKGWPLKRGDVKAEARAAKEKDGSHYKGLRLMQMKSNVTDKVQPPALSYVGPDKKIKAVNRLVPSDMQAAKQLFVGGNYAVAELNIRASIVSGMRYLTPYLNSIRYTREGAKFGAQGGALMSRFDGVVGGEADHDPTAGMDQEIPF